MAKMLRGMDGEYGMAGVKRKKARRGKKRKGGKGKAAPAGWKLIGRKTDSAKKLAPCRKATGKLRKGCKWGRGRFRGKLLKKVG
jgi:hypothetical protein